MARITCDLGRRLPAGIVELMRLVAEVVADELVVQALRRGGALHGPTAAHALLRAGTGTASWSDSIFSLRRQRLAAARLPRWRRSVPSLTKSPESSLSGPSLAPSARSSVAQVVRDCLRLAVLHCLGRCPTAMSSQPPGVRASSTGASG
jgi:hypothetical protein